MLMYRICIGFVSVDIPDSNLRFGIIKTSLGSMNLTFFINLRYARGFYVINLVGQNMSRNRFERTTKNSGWALDQLVVIADDPRRT